MKLYTKISSERGKELSKGGNDFLKITLQRDRDKLSHVIEYSEAGLRVSAITDNGGVVVYEEREKPTNKEAKKRLEYLRQEIRAERISYEELAELQSLASYIEKDDVELLEAAGVPEFEEEGQLNKCKKCNKNIASMQVCQTLCIDCLTAIGY